MTTEIITVIISSLGGGVAFWGAVKSGLIKIQIGKGNGNGVAAKLDEIENNHLSHIETKLDKLIEINQETLFIVKDLKDEQKKT